MNKFALSLLGLTAVMSIAGCSSTSSNTSSASKYMVPAESITVNVRSIALMVDEKYDLSVAIRPFAAYDAELTFESSDAKVAKVEKNGRVTAKKAGHATISIYTSNFVSVEKTPELFTTVEVYCYEKGKSSEKKTLLAEMSAYQEQHCQEELDNVILYDYRVYDLVREGVSQDRTDERQIYANSKSRGLMHYNSVEYDINVTEGGQTCEEYGYICQTKESYASYMYHYNDNVKNVFYIASEFNKGKVSRYETMQSILDCYFSVSNDYFTGAYEDIYSSDWFDILSQYGQLVKKFGGFKTDDEFVISYTLSQSYDDEFDAEDECRWATQLPAGIKYKCKESYTFTWVNGYLASENIESVDSFKMEGKSYEYKVSLNKTFVIASDAEMEKFVPVDSEFNNVEYWYEI